jgi:signal transduction histidine kinase
MRLPDLTARAARRPGVGPARTAATSLWWLVTGVGALLLLTVAVPVNAAVHDVPLLVAFLASTAQCAALPVALLHPRLATGLQLAGLVVLALTAQTVEGPLWPVSVTSTIALCGHVAVLGLRERWTLAVGTWWCSVLVAIGLVLVDPDGRGASATGVSLVAFTSQSVLVLAASIAYRRRDGVRRELAQARRDVELEQSRRALEQERTRIARDLHDVVAHSMSVVHMQASTAAYRLPDLDPRVRAEFAEIATAARSAMREMRQTLSVLRGQDDEVLTAPAPELARLPDLVAAASRAGHRVRCDIDPALGATVVPAGVGVTAYRVVQEALSNAVRHANGAGLSVEVTTARAGALLVTVTNEAPHRVTEDVEAVDEHGRRRAHLGLVGMRERVDLVGGQLEHGPTATGGYRVHARLPLDVGGPAAATVGADR